MNYVNIYYNIRKYLYVLALGLCVNLPNSQKGGSQSPYDSVLPESQSYWAWVKHISPNVS